MGAKKVVIKTKNPEFSGKREYVLNAGSLSLVFHEGVSAPITEKHAEAFLKHYSVGYKAVPVSEADNEEPEQQNDPGKKKGKEQNPEKGEEEKEDTEPKIAIRMLKKYGIYKDKKKVYQVKPQEADKLIKMGVAVIANVNAD